MSHDESKQQGANGDPPAPDPNRQDPESPERRQVLTRLGSALMIAGAAGLGTYAFYDRKRPVRSRHEPDRVIPDHRVQLAAGVPKMVIARGVEAKRHHLGVHVNEILEMLSSGPVVQDAGVHTEYGPLQQVVGLTGRSREVVLTVQADKLPLVFVDISADEEAPLPGAA